MAVVKNGKCGYINANGHEVVAFLIISTEILLEKYIKVKNNKLDYEDWYLGFVGFMGSFGARYFKGYARHNRYDKTEQIQKGSIKNFKKQ